MNFNVVVAGVGGQGALSLAAIIASTALRGGFNVKQTEVHGMAQKGGSVVSHVRIAEQAIGSDIVPLGRADLLIGVEILEAVRQVSRLSRDGWAVVADTRIENVAPYPDDEELRQQLIPVTNLQILDTQTMARQAGQARAANIVLLGAASAVLPFSRGEIETSLSEWFGRKGSDIVEKNLVAFEAGVQAVLAGEVIGVDS